ncbi:HTH domain-containing protein [Comamonas endophytica]|uniref:HTH domain-containing protein n=1 Tax=Comamonas endophytica TaxID=2949090 RepID=UPI00360CB5B2
MPRHHALLRLVLAASGPIQPGALEQALQVSRPTINRDLRDLLTTGFLEKLGMVGPLATWPPMRPERHCEFRLQPRPCQRGLVRCVGRPLRCPWSKRFLRLSEHVLWWVMKAVFG